MADLSDRIALVTGAASGIGLDVARQLAGLGATVVLTARSLDKAETAAGRLDGDVRALALDVDDAESVTAAAEAVRQRHGRLDVLVSNAAVFGDWQETPTTTDLDAARRIVDTNLFGTWRVAQAFAPLLRASDHARAVFVTSGAGSHGDGQFGLAAWGGGAASYGVSKAAANALVHKLAAELDGVLVNAVDPGLTATFEGAEGMGARPVEDGAASVVWACTLPADGPTGGFFRDGEALPW